MKFGELVQNNIQQDQQTGSVPLRDLVRLSLAVNPTEFKQNGGTEQQMFDWLTTALDKRNIPYTETYTSHMSSLRFSIEFDYDDYPDTMVNVGELSKAASEFVDKFGGFAIIQRVDD